ncbi:unnamed protein product [Arabidopsis arenosa]|uniref:Tubby C-terminal domain-containing protein n=1 Tax=Arabidopsis arenosa TaxID=38785 RepID=A0A8S1ZKW2_ARAAE|nr:unnamed protein product [Arabidopsis arenosa]
MDAIPASAVEPGGTAPTQTELDNFVSFKSPSGQKEGVLVLKSKVPRWEGQSWCLYFNGRRDIVASGRNFQLVAAPENGPEGLENGDLIFQFAKVREDDKVLLEESSNDGVAYQHQRPNRLRKPNPRQRHVDRAQGFTGNRNTLFPSYCSFH